MKKGLCMNMVLLALAPLCGLLWAWGLLAQEDGHKALTYVVFSLLMIALVGLVAVGKRLI